MRRLRRASLIVTLCLLTSTAMADAGYGWVLWSYETHVHYRSYSPTVEYWDIQEAFDSKGACQQVVDRIYADWEVSQSPHSKGSLPTTSIAGKQLVYRFFDVDGGMTEAYLSRLICLPSDFDPRRGEDNK